MPRGPLAFRENDVARAMRAAAKAGAPFHVRIEHATGDILILPGAGAPVHVPPPQPATAPDTPEAALEAWLNGGVSETSGGA